MLLTRLGTSNYIQFKQISKRPNLIRAILCPQKGRIFTRKSPSVIGYAIKED